MKHIQAVLILIIGTLSLQAQDLEMANGYVDSLCSNHFAGRGYIGKGDSLAADYIASHFKKEGLNPLTDSYLQHFDMPINTIKSCRVEQEGVELKAGYDYMIGPASKSINKVNKRVFPVSLKMLHSPAVAKKVRKAVCRGMIPVISSYPSKDTVAVAAVARIKASSKAKVLIFIKKNLTWTLSRSQSRIAEVWILESAYDAFGKLITIQIESEFIPNYRSQNVCAYVPGTSVPDSFVILCGHYDHLGKMGEATYYGANDNASGITMLMQMAHYFSSHPQRYSLLFIAFGGEEAGLLGSHDFVTNPPDGFSLNSLQFVFNMDLMGNGQDGATIVNGSVFPDHYQAFVHLNNEHNYLPEIKSRGKAANSDHYFFGEIGIPSFFIYTMGPYLYYHVPQDNAENLELGESYQRTFKLVRDFIIELNQLN